MNEARDLIGRMPDEELEKMILQLSYYTSKVRRSYRWRIKEGGALPKGETVNSIVSLAFEKVYAGERRWDSALQPDFMKFMRDVIDSLIYHLAWGKDNTSLAPVPAEEIEEWQSSLANAEPAAEWLARGEATPEETLIAKESRAQKDLAIRLLLEECAEDASLIRIVDAMLDGCDRCADIAEAAGLEVRDVYNAMKRLDRKIASVRKRMADSPRGGISSEQKYAE
ncbi:MAG: hypothetical protein J2P41_01785 [Blastocatellia bacterium]|nr:hypothetical protein [Blastocatellia bacterium]